MAKDESWQRLVSRVEALAQEEPRTKTGKIQQLLPRIEESVRAGITLKQLCEELNTEGLKISYRDFRVLLSRVRRKARKEPPAYTPREKVGASAVENSQSHPVRASMRSQEEQLKREKFVHRNVPDENNLY